MDRWIGEISEIGKTDSLLAGWDCWGECGDGWLGLPRT